MTEEQLKNMAAQLRKPEGEDGLKTAEMMSAANKYIINDAFRALQPKAYDNILEIGMGDGFYVKEILQISERINYSGCDYSELMVAQSKKLNADWISNGRARFIVSDASSLPFSDEEFNKVFTVNTIYFWENVKHTLTEVKRVLKPAGKLITAFRPKHQMEKYPFTKYGFIQYARTDVETLLHENGFSVVESFENKESDFDLNGQPVTRENVVIVASKI